ncbi:MAG: hypothetical protein ACRD33_09325, partial [Candidatus Acidiferrales bacterium]
TRTLRERYCGVKLNRRRCAKMIEVTRENHEAPAELQARVARAGGVNRYGEANFRVVWGWSRLAWIGGKWTDTDASGNVIRQRIEMREVPKYFPFERWHIERWTPPEAYGSPEMWYSQTIEREDGILIPALGPFPRRGEYEHCFTLQGADGEFIPLSPTVCEAIVLAVEYSRGCPAEEHRAAIEKREERREREWDSHADAVLDDSGRAFHGVPFVATA